MKSVPMAVILSCLSLCAAADPNLKTHQAGSAIPAAVYAPVADSLRVEGLQSEKAFALLADLVRTCGHRLPGSPGAACAVDRTRKLMADLGFETWLEPTTVQHWVRGAEEAAIIGSPGKTDVALSIAALGGSVPTAAAGLTAPVIEVGSFEDLEKLGPAVSGKIVFFNHPMDRTRVETFSAYGEVARFRAAGASRAARHGAVAVIVRSATPRIDDFPHTGMMAYEPGIAKIPAAAVSTEDAEVLSARLKAEPKIRIRFRLGCATLDPVPTSNVIGQIRGTKNPEEIIVVSGHLDSWDQAVGAHDDGAGCVQAIEALRLIRAAGLKPRRTIRAVMFMNEEFGSSGGRDYAVDPRRSAEKPLVAMESDRGGFLPLAFGVGGPPEILRKYAACGELLRGLGLSGTLIAGGGGSDIGPIVQKGAVPMGFIPNAQTYFDVHHSGLDTLDSVHPRELELGAIALALMAYIAAEEGL